MIALQKLIAGAVDYAGLFPPAALPIKETVENFAQYKFGTAHSMLGRLVVPVGRLGELQQAANQVTKPWTAHATASWQISALVNADSKDDFADFHQALQQLRAFNDHYRNRNLVMLIDSIEIKPQSLDDLPALAQQIPTELDAYFEIDCQTDPNPAIQHLAEARRSALERSISAENGTSARKPGSNLYAKIRTGSVVADQIPSVPQVARFIATCAKYGVPFKATAGLHHPVRDEYRLTYEPDSKCGVMHGFVNVFVASLFAFELALSGEKMETEMETEIEAILAEQEKENFSFDDHQLRWRERSIAAERIDNLRRRSIQSFGSCSFDEPVQELSTQFGDV